MAYEDKERCCQLLRTQVCEWLRSLDPDLCLADAQQAFVRVQPNSIYRLMDAIDTLCGESLSIQDAFEEVLTWAEREGAFQPKAGQIMTPMHIAYLMADLLRLKRDERVIDASCGVGNLLVAAWQHMQSSTSFNSWLLSSGQILFQQEVQQPSPSLLGYDFNAEMLPACYAHLLLSGFEKPHVRCSDALGSVFNEQMTRQMWGDIDVCMGNSPFSKYRGETDLGETLRHAGTIDTELLFLDLTLQLLRDGGRAALLVPDGVVRNTSTAAVALRKKLVQDHRLQAVISLPSGIFLPQTNVKCSLLLFRKGCHTGQDVFFYRVSEDGYSLDSKRRAVPIRTDLWDVRMRYAAAIGEEQPLPVPELVDPSWWEQYVSQQAHTSTRVIPQIKEEERNPANGERVSPFQRITSFTEAATEGDRFWLVSLAEIEQSGSYSLCADAYRRENTATRHISPHASRARMTQR